MKPDCYQCAHRGELPGDAHSKCKNKEAKVTGNPYGIKNGWFIHPFNFDPVWLETCSGFEAKQSTKVSGAVGQAAQG